MQSFRLKVEIKFLGIEKKNNKEQGYKLQVNPLTPEIRNIDFRHIKPYIFLKALCYLIQIHRKNM